MNTRAAALGAVAAAVWVGWRLRPGPSIRDQVALVTGGSRGLGFHIARHLLEEGCHVAICARDPDALARAHRRLAAHGRVLSVQCDVADPAQVERTVERTAREFGRIDILVNNASTIEVGPLDALTREDFERVMDINFWGVFHATMAVLPLMRARGGGRIANITSIGARVAVPHLLPYDCAKFAAYGLSEGLRTELAPDGISVTTVVPGLMRTGSPIHVDYRGDAAAEFLWFAAGDLLPISAMSADRAARRIVRAIRRREVQVTLSWQAVMLRLVHALAPSTTVRALTVANRLLPDDADPHATPGRELLHTLPRPLRAALDRAAVKGNQLERSPT